MVTVERQGLADEWSSTRSRRSHRTEQRTARGRRAFDRADPGVRRLGTRIAAERLEYHQPPALEAPIGPDAGATADVDHDRRKALQLLQRQGRALHGAMLEEVDDQSIRIRHARKKGVFRKSCG